MTLTIDSQDRSKGDGIFISEATVVHVEDISGTTPVGCSSPVDIGIRLTLDIGKTFQPQLNIAGWFKRDPSTNEVVGWGSAFVVREALARLGYAGPLAEGNTLQYHAHLLVQVVGKRLLRLNYRSGVREDGTSRFSNWNQFATLEEGAEALRARFLKSISKGYPRNYVGSVSSGTTSGVAPNQPVPVRRREEVFDAF